MTPIDGPHYLLLTDAARSANDERQWRFVLQPVGDGTRIVAEDAEVDADSNRLELLAVVRGLEALDGPSRVTLLCASRYVRRGIQNDLEQWRECGWRWERFGKQVSIRDLDLWRRLDRALSIHDVECYFGLRIADCGWSGSTAEAPSAIRNPQSTENEELSENSDFGTWGHGGMSGLAPAGGAALSRSA